MLKKIVFGFFVVGAAYTSFAIGNTSHVAACEYGQEQCCHATVDCTHPYYFPCGQCQ